MILDQSGIFTQSIQSNNTSIIPVVVFSKNNIDHYISTNAVTMDDNYYEPLLLNIPSIRESVDFEKRNFKIGNISLSISNSAYGGDKRFSDNLPDIMNADCLIYYKTTVTQNLNDCLKVYQGKVKRMSHDDTAISLQVEDLSQENLHKELPTQRVQTDLEILDRYKNKPIPFVYGENNTHKVVVKPQSDINSDFDVISDKNDVEIYKYKAKKDYTYNPLYTVIDSQKIYIAKNLNKFNEISEENNVYDYSDNDPVINLIRTYDVENGIPKSAFANNIVEILYDLTPKITLNNDIGFKDQASQYIQGQTAGEAPMQFDHSSFEFVNKNNILDNDYFNYATINSIDLQNTDECFMSNQTILSQNLNEYPQYPEMQNSSSTVFLQNFIVISADFYRIENDDIEYYHLAYPKIQFKAIKKEHNFSGIHPSGDAVILVGYTTYNNFSQEINPIVENLGEFDGWFENEVKYYSADLLPVTTENFNTINITMFPSNIIISSNPTYNNLRMEFNMYRFDFRYHGKLNNVFQNDFYVDIKGRKGIENIDFKTDYIRRKKIGENVIILNQLGGVQGVLFSKDDYRYINDALFINDIIEFDEIINNVKYTSRAKVLGIEEYFYINQLYWKVNIQFINEMIQNSILSDIYLIENYIELPCDIIRHILINEIEFDNEINESELQIAREESNGFYFSISQSKFINSKKLIENIAKQSKFFPKFRNDGTFGFNIIKDQYSDEDAETIETRDIINYKFDRTKIDDVKTKIKIIYGKDNISEDFLKATDYITGTEYYNGYNNSYIGLEEDHRTSTLDFEAEYIQHDETANLLRNFLLSWYANQHNIITVDLPLRYLKFEVGDVVKFDGLINNLKLYGEDYTIINNRNGQDIYPYFMIMETVKNINKITFKLLQLHKNLPVEQQDDIQTELNRSGMKIPLEQEIDQILKPTNIIPTDDVIPRTESQDDDGQDVGSGGRGGGGY